MCSISNRAMEAYGGRLAAPSMLNLDTSGQIHTQPLYPRTTNLFYRLDKRQDWTHSLSGHCREQETVLLLPGLPNFPPNSPQPSGMIYPDYLIPLRGRCSCMQSSYRFPVTMGIANSKRKTEANILFSFLHLAHIHNLNLQCGEFISTCPYVIAATYKHLQRKENIQPWLFLS